VGLGRRHHRERLLEELIKRVRKPGEHVMQVIAGPPTTLGQGPKWLEPLLEYRLQQPGTVLVVVEDARLRDTGQGGDLARGHPGDPALAQQLERGGKDRLAP